MPRIIAYTYEADVHCPECTRQRFGKPDYPPELTDEHDIPLSTPEDREGNKIRPVFSTDEEMLGGWYCGDCHFKCT